PLPSSSSSSISRLLAGRGALLTDGPRSAHARGVDWSRSSPQKGRRGSRKQARDTRSAAPVHRNEEKRRRMR
ncbi:hypothetical protein PENTCL1PPCAC_7100, partial [Pristionchus entomophagus]